MRCRSLLYVNRSRFHLNCATKSHAETALEPPAGHKWILCAVLIPNLLLFIYYYYYYYNNYIIINYLSFAILIPKTQIQICAVLNSLCVPKPGTQNPHTSNVCTHERTHSRICTHKHAQRKSARKGLVCVSVCVHILYMHADIHTERHMQIHTERHIQTAYTSMS